LGTAQLNATSGGVPGSFSYSPPAGTVLNAGSNQVLSATFTPADLSTYARFTTTVPITVLKAPLTITAQNKAKVYGAAIPALTASYSGFVLGQTFAALESPAVLATTAVPASTTGSYPISASGAVSGNYQFTYIPGTLLINKASLAAILTSSKILLCPHNRSLFRTC
jgi:hypothetical protein